MIWNQKTFLYVLLCHIANFRVGFDVLPQEVAAGEMLEAKVLGDPLAHGALARAGRPKDDRPQEFGSHCLREEWGGHPGNLDNGLGEAPGTLFPLPLLLTPSARAGTRWPPRAAWGQSPYSGSHT